MDDKVTATASAPAKDFKADPEFIALEQIIASERKAQGIEPAPEPKAISDVLSKSCIKLSELSADQLAEIDRRSREYEQDQLRQRTVKNFSELCIGVGREAARFTLDSYRLDCREQRNVVETLREYLKDFLPTRLDSAQGLVLFGPVGTGKDHLAFAVAREAVLKHGLRARWINCQDWFGRLRDNMDTDRSEASEVSSLVVPELLILSDPLPPFGDLTQFQANLLYRVMLGRVYDHRLTFVTVNVADDAEADRRLGVATWDRMCAGAWKLHCRWPSFRKPARCVNC